jgi:hypothetical protein
MLKMSGDMEKSWEWSYEVEASRTILKPRRSNNKTV